MPPARILRLEPDQSRLDQWTRANRFGTKQEAVLWLLHRIPAKRRPQVFYIKPDGAVTGYGTAGTAALRQEAAAAAVRSNPFPPERIRTRPFPPAWRRGQRLPFEARLRPVRRNEDPGPIPKELLSEWLAGRLEHAANLEQVKVGSWNTDRSAHFAGRLIVLDGEAFRQTLLAGAGRGIRRGYGMIRIKE